MDERKPLQTGEYYVSVMDKLLKVSHSGDPSERYSDMVDDFGIFERLEIYRSGDVIHLVILPGIGAAFVKNFDHNGIPDKYLTLDDVFGDSKKLNVPYTLHMVRKGDPADEEKKEETLRDRLQRIDEERVKLLEEIVNEDRSKEYQKIAKEIALMAEAFQNSGFSRKETIQMTQATLQTAAMAGLLS